MSGPLYDRVALNTWLVGQLTTTDLPIGLGVAPDGCGWVNGGSPAEGNTPGSTFSAFATLTPGTGAAHFRNPLADSTSSYAQPYSLTSVGGVPEQTEDAASGLRTLVAAIGKTKLDLGGPWAVEVRHHHAGGIGTQRHGQPALVDRQRHRDAVAGPGPRLVARAVRLLGL
jgi:hypothetical protein